MTKKKSSKYRLTICFILGLFIGTFGVRYYDDHYIIERYYHAGAIAAFNTLTGCTGWPEFKNWEDMGQWIKEKQNNTRKQKENSDNYISSQD